jgi:hypothetical protein
MTSMYFQIRLMKLAHLLILDRKEHVKVQQE